jgi:hypothetical protein
MQYEPQEQQDERDHSRQHPEERRVHHHRQLDECRRVHRCRRVRRRALSQIEVFHVQIGKTSDHHVSV